jgi:putative SOS response-associated peptidase YedK
MANRRIQGILRGNRTRRDQHTRRQSRGNPSVRVQDTTANDGTTTDTNDYTDINTVSIGQDDTIENLSPGGSCPVIFSDSSQQYYCDKMVWGLIPKYFKPEESYNHYRLFNKQIESFDPKIQYFYQLLSTKRCVLVFDGFYEWKMIAGKKQPYYVHLSDKPMQMAGIYEDSQIVDPKTNEKRFVRTFSIVTSQPCEKFKEIHNRQPVMLTDSQVDFWLNLDSAAEEVLQVLKENFSNVDIGLYDDLEFYPVTSKVTDPKYQENDCSIQINLGSKPINLFFMKSVDSVALQDFSLHKIVQDPHLSAPKPGALPSNYDIKQVLNYEDVELPSQKRRKLEVIDLTESPTEKEENSWNSNRHGPNLKSGSKLTLPTKTIAKSSPMVTRRIDRYFVKK